MQADGTADSGPKSEAGRCGQAGVSVLVVDDNQMMCCVVERMVTALVPGGTCTVSCCGKDVLALVRQAPHQLGLIDLTMPDMSGKEVARKIREIEQELGRPPMPLIAMSANPLAEEWTECRRAGFSTFLEKPFCASVMRTCIQSLLPDVAR